MYEFIIQKGKQMKYILMIIMFICSIAICKIINKSKKDRVALLNEIKASTKSCDIHKYFLTIEDKRNIYIPKVKRFVDNVAQKRSTALQTKDEMFATMNQVLFERTDNAMIRRWLSLVERPEDDVKRADVDKQCTTLIEKTKIEEKSNMYIAVALAVVLIIVVI